MKAESSLPTLIRWQTALPPESQPAVYHSVNLTEEPVLHFPLNMPGLFL